jgi:uncharacterized membrane protein YdjX (TVP38/TMEM64 family)
VPDKKSLPSQASSQRRTWWPLAVLALVAGAVLVLGGHDVLTLRTIGLNYDLLRTSIAAHLPVALGLYALLYMAVVALSLPGAAVLTIAGGLLFGWKLGIPATVISATAGATVLFLVARSSLGGFLTERAGPWLSRLRAGFAQNALSYLLFLRLTPVFPFVVVNLAAAALGVPLRTYVLGTFLGIIPGTAAFSVAGAGLGSVIHAQNKSHQACLSTQPANPDLACPYEIDAGALVTREVILALIVLGLSALIPVAIKKWRARHAAVEDGLDS